MFKVKKRKITECEDDQVSIIHLLNLSYSLSYIHVLFKKSLDFRYLWVTYDILNRDWVVFKTDYRTLTPQTCIIYLYAFTISNSSLSAVWDDFYSVAFYLTIFGRAYTELLPCWPMSHSPALLKAGSLFSKVLVNGNYSETLSHLYLSLRNPAYLFTQSPSTLTGGSSMNLLSNVS